MHESISKVISKRPDLIAFLIFYLAILKASILPLITVSYKCHYLVELQK